MKNNYFRIVYDIYSRVVRVMPFQPLPRVLVWELTYDCNCRCKMCPFYGEGVTQPWPQEAPMTKDQISSSLLSIKKDYGIMPLPFIGFTGGEPFMNRDALEIFKLAKSLGFNFSITTNFSCVSLEMIDELINCACPTELRVSLDGPREIHDYVRNVPIYDKVIDNIRYINGRVPVTINCTISKYNYSQLFEFVTQLQQMEISINLSIQHLIFLDQSRVKIHNDLISKIFGQEHSISTNLVGLTPNEVDLLLRQFKKLYDSGASFEVTPDIRLIDSINKYYSDLSWKRRDKCTFVFGSVRISPGGNVYPCFDLKFGNILDMPLKKIWNGEVAKRFRQDLKKRRLYPGCVRCCRL